MLRVLPPTKQTSLALNQVVASCVNTTSGARFSKGPETHRLFGPEGNF